MGEAAGERQQRAVTFERLIGLLARTGLRSAKRSASTAMTSTPERQIPDQTVRDSKFGKSREVLRYQLPCGRALW